MSATTNDVEPTVATQPNPTTPTDTTPTLSPQCDKLFGLSAGTAAWDNKYLTPELCAADQDLISRYTPGSCSSQGLTDPKTQGILKLNPAFAIALDKMLKAMPMQMGIISAYRKNPCPNADGVAATNSSHMYGCAVDLNYDEHTCNSTACQWVRSHASAYGIQLRLQYSPEFNHVEPANLAQCKAGAVVSPPTTPPVTTPGAGMAAVTDKNGKTVLPGGTGSPQPQIGKLTCSSIQTVNGQTICIQSNNGLGTGGLFGGSGNMMEMMLGMQLGSTLGQALGNLFSSQNSTAAQPAPAAPLPPAAPAPTSLPPISITPSSSSTIDALIAALGEDASSTASTSSVPSLPSSTTTMGVITPQTDNTSAPITSTNTTAGSGSVTVNNPTVNGGNVPGASTAISTSSGSGSSSAFLSLIQAIQQTLANMIATLGSFLTGSSPSSVTPSTATPTSPSYSSSPSY